MDTAECTRSGRREYSCNVTRNDETNRIFVDGEELAPKYVPGGSDLTNKDIQNALESYIRDHNDAVKRDILLELTPFGKISRGAKAARGARGAKNARRAGKVCCFVAGTLVHTAGGLRPIEEIKVGDLVLSKSDASGEIDYKPVAQTFVRDNRFIWELKIEISGQTETFKTTDDHPWRSEKGQWLPTSLLQSGMLLKTKSDQLGVVTSIRNTKKIERTYNIDVEGFDTFFVGESGVWVHNQNCATPATGAEFRRVAGKGRSSQDTWKGPDGSIWQRERATNSGSGGHGGSAWKRWPDRRSFERGDKPQTISADGRVLR